VKDLLQSCFDSIESAAVLPEDPQRRLAGMLGTSCRARVHARSITPIRRSLIFLCTNDGGKRLGIVSPVPGVIDELKGFEDQILLEGLHVRMRTERTTTRSAAWLRQLLPYLKARPLGLKRSAGFGDRLGLATPGHVRAVRKTNLAPIFAQQSVRENERTGRSPQEVLDDAMWGAFQEGWIDGFGADADHLKTAEHASAFAAAGFSFFTVDPGEYVDNAASQASPHVLEQKLQSLPWAELETTFSDLQRTLAEKPIDLGMLKATFRIEDIGRAAAKYGKAVAHTVHMYRHLENAAAGKPFEFEMSVDETDSPTTLAEHVYIASELKRSRVQCVSLAPRYVGAFEKGVDYIGDLAEFESSFAGHVAVAKTYGPYKLSLHSGSDKFSIYPIAARLAGDLVHLKTAGTSYLEALRAIGRCNPRLFREIHGFAVERYPTDRASYHVSAEIARMPDAAALSDEELPGLLEDFHTREVLHVTYGSVLNEARFRARFFEALRRHEEDYTRIVETHFDRHLARFQ
jgi:tagaturonate epimerase